MKKLISLRIDEELLEELRMEARQQNRSLNNLIEVLLLEQIKKLLTKGTMNQ